MKGWLVIADVAAALFLIVMLHTTYLEVSNYKEQYYEQRLMRSAEYACECAFYYASGMSSDTGVLYLNAANRVMSTKDVLNNFDDIMALCYGLGTGEKSRTMIEDSIGTACLVAGNGFYLTDLNETSEDAFELVWSPKIPYSADLNQFNDDATDDNVVSGITYSVTLDSEEWKKVAINGTLYTYDHGERYSQTTGALSRAKADRIISSKLTSCIAASVDRNTQIRNSSDYSVYVPTAKTQGGINSMKNPTLLVVLKNADYAKWTGTGATLAGFQIVTGTKAVSYMKGGKKMYCYEGQGAVDAGYKILQMYDTAEQAAADGCYPDTEFLFKPIKGATA